MRILFCSHNPLLRTLGTPKVLIELAESMATIGWTPEFVQPSDLGMNYVSREADREVFSIRLHEYLRRRSYSFDVIDYDHEYLPFSRSDFNRRVLMVARSALLSLHLQTNRIPVARGLKAIAGRARRFVRMQREIRATADRSNRTLREADLINLNNTYDRALLIGSGFPESKIVVLPLGISGSRRLAFESVAWTLPAAPMVGFVGSFDYRKGALDFPKIVATLVAAVPGVRFKLLGTNGLFSGTGAVKAFFPKKYRSIIEVVPQFDPDQLPALLSGVSVGIFPSYLEGFGLGVLEMLAAAIPVIAYDVPGPPEMLPCERLTQPGNHQEMARKAIELLNNPAELVSARVAARESSRRFNWAAIARDTANAYTEAFEKLKDK